MSTQDSDEKVKVKVRAIIEFEIEADPKYASKEHIEFYRNEGTYCWDNFVDELKALRKKQKRKGSCLCSLPINPRFEVLTESTSAPPSPDAELWYLQDTRSLIGNDVTWWAKDGNGYTTDVSKAHAYPREEAFRRAAMRGCDRAWPKAYIDGKTRPAVDFQYINHAEALASEAIDITP